MIRSLIAPLAATLVAAAGAASALELGDGLVRTRHGAWPVAEGPAAPLPAREASFEGVAAWIVAADGPLDAALRRDVEASGARIAGFVPSSAWIVRADAGTARALARRPRVARVERWRDAWKVEPGLDDGRLARAGDALLFVSVWSGEDAAAAAGAVRATGAEVLRVWDRPDVRRLLVRPGSARLAEIAAVPAVEWIEDVGRLTLRNDVVRWVIQSDVPDSTPLHDRGLLGAGEILGHIDGPIFLGSCYFADPEGDPPGPDHRKLAAWRKITGPDADAHGTHTAGTAAGRHFSPDSTRHRGMAPQARLSHSSYYDLNGEYNGMPSNLLEFLELAHADGARIHTNSWGDDARTSYTSWCVDIDTFARAHEEDLVVFAATNTATVKSPENAKNALAVGATYPPPNQDTRWSGGAGPTADGRRKPEVFAPGRNTLSASPQACAVVTSSGTSMAAPAVAGGAALVREYFRRGYHPTGAPWPSHAFVPTGALLKAAVVNSTVDLEGIVGYPSDGEGWGRIVLDRTLRFPGDARRLWVRDVRNTDGLETGEVLSWTVEVTDSGEPLAITMAFTDQPASLGAALAPVNDLDLEVEGPNGFFLGNRIDPFAEQSVPGGPADPLNDVERVLVTLPLPGTWTIAVRAVSVPLGPQGFGVVANGALGRDRRTGSAPDDPPAARTIAGLTGRLPEYRLDPPRPSPFTERTALTWSVPRPARAAVRVYDTAGRLVRTLLDGRVAAGEQRVDWDGRDAAGRPVVPGVYFLRVTAPDFDRSVRAVRLR